VIARLFVGPLLVVLLAAINLLPRGAPTAAVGAYVTFVCAETAVVWWARYQLRLARRRFAARRRSCERRRAATLAYDRDDGRRVEER
jgi:hypothetical protein